MTKSEIKALIVEKYDVALTCFYSSLMNSDHYNSAEKSRFNQKRILRLNEFRALVDDLCKEE